VPKTNNPRHKGSGISQKDKYFLRIKGINND